jgi:ATP-dependent exoDNAse (exonuclease V) beta subunit
MSLDDFVAELSLVREENPREADAPPEDASNTVKVMTVHSAKGLEFPVVFLVAMEKGVSKGGPPIGFSRRSGLGARWRNPATGKDKNDLFAHSLHEEWKARDEAESSRLLYVAMTRAEEHLVLSWSAERKPLNWAKVVSERLGIDGSTPRDEVVTYRAPDGESWKLAVRVALEAPELLTRERLPEELREPLAIARPDASGQQDTNATVTGLAVYASCPRKYYLGAYLGYEGRARRLSDAVEDGELSAGEFGSQVHELLAGDPLPDASADALRLAQVFHTSELGRRAAQASRLEREFDFTMAIEGLVVRGQIDLWFEEGGELVVMDYKTNDVRAADVQELAGDGFRAFPE